VCTAGPVQALAAHAEGCWCRRCGLRPWLLHIQQEVAQPGDNCLAACHQVAPAVPRHKALRAERRERRHVGGGRAGGLHR